MPRQRKDHHREAHAFPEDFPRRLKRLKEESGLTWTEFASRLGTNPLTVRRWRHGTRPNALHLYALLELAVSLDLPGLLSERAAQLGNDDYGASPS